MTAIYRGMDQAALDAGYNNSLAVANSAELMAHYGALSAQMRHTPGAKIGLRYGPAPRNLIDYFPAAAPGPLLVFIHGGYWQMRSKDDFSFLAKGPLAHGMHVALVGYTLAPEARLWFIESGGPQHYAQVQYGPDDYLVFGRETAGVPKQLLEENGGRWLRIPMFNGEARSLNLSNCVALVLYEALRQQGFAGEI